MVSRRGGDVRAADRVYRRLLNLLDQANAFDDAWDVCQRGPLAHEPGGIHYTRLGQFLHGLRRGHDDIPEAADQGERAAYLALLERLNATGELKPGVLDRLRPQLEPRRPR